MTHKRATEILKKKYPEAEIYRPSAKCALCRKGSIAVVFTPNGRTYSYLANNYADVLERLGCEIEERG